MLKNIKLPIVAAAACLLIASSAFAEKRSFGQIYTECGLGGMIGSAISDKSASQVVAVITNVTWDLGTTASSSASTDACSNEKVRVANYINQSFEKLEKEIAQGEGKYLDGLASMTVGENGSKTEYATKLRSEFGSVVATQEYNNMSRYEKVEKLFSIAI